MEHAIYPYAKAAAHLYGIYHIQDLMDLLKHYEQKEFYRKEVLSELSDLLKADDELELVGSYVYQTSSFSSFDQALALYKKNRHKPFYYPEFADLSHYVNRDYLQVFASHRAMANFLKQHSNASEREITQLLRNVLVKVRKDCDMHHIMKEFFLLGQMKQHELTEFSNLLNNILNDTRRFSNHGFTPNELRQQMQEKNLLK